MSGKMDDQEQGDAKLEDILKSIRGVMDNHNHADVVEQNSVRPTGEKEPVLELISVVGTEDTTSTEALIFEENKRRTESEINKIAKHLGEAEYLIKGKSLDLTINELMRPLVEEWLDNNLPQIVEKVVGEEIQKMVSKI